MVGSSLGILLGVIEDRSKHRFLMLCRYLRLLRACNDPSCVVFVVVVVVGICCVVVVAVVVVVVVVVFVVVVKVEKKKEEKKDLDECGKGGKRSNI